ncbi:hypothetical protein DI09_120p20 [Mitosporidium daphniae]|uniref:Uncharacterized protein n=1 Tax=Mitosporidium daphniae TaxID=1485682 RepID=A0A098VZ03_9MICR|nr:uncharacterized protein DI09_120p20 [Mitosporidium daphniae]KGG52951.1 hypothetical protein DI09_120p20 [Mitosporidium daphniae]|eukprot:XP_013239387.1 uncharacterized protein DI09_120p20 [Mitosporidium daphniae]
MQSDHLKFDLVIYHEKAMECFSFGLTELEQIILRNIIEIKHLELEYVVVIQISKFQSRAQLDSFLNLYQKGLLFILMLTAMAINVIAYEIKNIEPGLGCVTWAFKRQLFNWAS